MTLKKRIIRRATNSVCLLVSFFILGACNKSEKALAETEVIYTMPEESYPHEGTWLQWPHHYQYGIEYRNSLDATWLAMTKELVSGEKVHIIAYDEVEKERILALLVANSIDLTNIDFKIFKTDDVWVRDNGPIFVHDKNGDVVIQDWGFNGWGNKIDQVTGELIQSGNCNLIPQKIATDLGLTLVDLNNTLINEGGSIEIDGNGTLMACESSILNKNRNPKLRQLDVEIIFKKYLGVTNFIWLKGRAGLDITDQHIDGFARFGNATTIVTMNEADLLNFDVRSSDIDRLYAAKDKEGVAYTILKVPLTQNDVITANGVNLGYKGSYVNYYIGNDCVLVPNYQDPNDEVANAIIQTLYPTRLVVGIDVRNLYENGGMVHCVTQQQPY